MRIRVIAHDVTVAHLGPYQRGVRFGLLANDEERGGNMLLAQDGEDLRRPSRIGSVVKSEGNDAAGPDVFDGAQRWRVRFFRRHRGLRGDGELVERAGFFGSDSPDCDTGEVAIQRQLGTNGH